MTEFYVKSFVTAPDEELAIGGIVLVTEDEGCSLREGHPVATARELARELLLRQVPELEGATLTWADDAGCPCGCLPGFRVSGLTSFDGLWGNALIGLRAVH
jgi:hypothetical protein